MSKEPNHHGTNPIELLCYRGPMDQDFVVATAEKMQAWLPADRPKQVRRLVRAFIEMGQNIQRHGADPSGRGDRMAMGTIRLVEEPLGWSLIAQNWIASAQMEALKAKGEAVLALDGPGLREAIRTTIQAPRQNRGAGLGLLELARISDRPISFHFRDCTSGLIQFECCIFVARDSAEQTHA
ncbi:MAG: SiaB family protein kinase [Acidobacteria bacterium]|nr:SiaB family protein kinase [Acidobacteriota bacterium]